MKVLHPCPHSPAQLPWPRQLSAGRTRLTGAAMSRGSLFIRAHAFVVRRRRRRAAYEAARRRILLQRSTLAHSTQDQPL